jgi:predicted PurR-regulated permease PerM
MAPNDQKTEVVPPAEVPENLPLPADPKVIFLGGLFVLAVLAAAYVASEIVLPLVFIISLVFWFWMWGIPGGILSMPMLAITKIICDRLQPPAFGHFLEG